MSYAIREVDGGDDEHALDIALLHRLTFGDCAPAVETNYGHWWLVYFADDPMPVAFAGLTQSSLAPNVGYLKRAGVLRKHTGQGLQSRLIRTREARARRNGWSRIVTDTTDNVQSANNLIRAGYRMFAPAYPWAFPTTLYWTKNLKVKT